MSALIVLLSLGGSPVSFQNADVGRDLGTGAAPAATGSTGELVTGTPGTDPAPGEFALFELKYNATDIVAAIQKACDPKKEKSDACTKWGPDGTEFDLAAVLGSRPLKLTFFMVERAALLTAVQAFASERNAGTNIVIPSLTGAGAELEPILGKVLQGLALALKKRAEAEALVVVLDEIDAKLCQAGGRVLLPRTCAAIDKQVAGANLGLTVLTMLRQTLIDDLRHLPGATLQTLLKARGVAAPTRDAASQLADDLIAGARAPVALDRFSQALDRETNQPAEVLSCGSSVPFAFLSYADEIDQTTRRAPSMISETDKSAALLGMALLRSRCDWILGSDHQAAVRNAAHLAGTLERWGADFRHIRADFQSIAQAAARIGGATSESARLAFILDELTTSADAARETTGWLFGAVSDLAKDTTHPKLAGYASTLLPAINTAKTDVDRVVAIAPAVTGMIQGALSHDFGAVWTGLFALASDESLKLKDAIPPEVLNYGGVLLAIVQAKDSDEVADVILAAAAPADSWRAKYGHAAGGPLMLGGLLGVGGDFAVANVPPGFDETRPRLVASFGVDWVIAGCESFNAGLYFQLLDLGAYLQSDQQGLQDPRLLQAVSPGLAARFGLGGLPVVATVGVAYDFDHGYPVQPTDAHPARGFRAFAALAFDVPLFVLSH